jgi:hypothetical protein
LMPAKKTENNGCSDTPSENKDSTYSQRFQKERDMTFEFIKKIQK